MRIFIGEMFENRAYRVYSKAVRRLNPQLEQMKEIFSPVKLDGEQFDDIMVTFVDQASPYYHEVKNRDRIYDVEVAVPEMETYKPEEDEALLLKIAAQLREVLERAPVRESARAEMLERFSKWESSIRQGSMRAV